MNGKKQSQSVIWLILATLIMVGCGSPTATPTPIPPTATPIPPTDTPEPTPEYFADFEVTFDGENCISDGPTELPAGEYTFDFTDQSDSKWQLWLVYLDDNKDFQDLLDLQSEPGEWDPLPSWAHYDEVSSSKTQKSNGYRVNTSAWKLDRVGEHIIFCYLDSPRKIYYAGPFMIVETNSD